MAAGEVGGETEISHTTLQSQVSTGDTEAVSATAQTQNTGADATGTAAISRQPKHAELEKLPVGKLRAIAADIGVDSQQIELARDSSDPRSDLMALIVLARKGVAAHDPVLSLDVGGVSYRVALSTLRAVPNSRLGAMISDVVEPGEYEVKTGMLDRDGQSFRWILSYLRWVVSGSVPPLALPADAGNRLQLAEEAAFFGLGDLELRCRRPRIEQHQLAILLATATTGARLPLQHCDLSGLRLTDPGRMDLCGADVSAAVVNREHQLMLSNVHALYGLDSVVWV